VGVITCDKFLAIGYGISILWGVKNGGFPLTKPVAVNTELRNCATYDEMASRTINAYTSMNLEMIL